MPAQTTPRSPKRPRVPATKPVNPFANPHAAAEDAAYRKCATKVQALAREMAATAVCDFDVVTEANEGDFDQLVRLIEARHRAIDRQGDAWDESSDDALDSILSTLLPKKVRDVICKYRDGQIVRLVAHAEAGYVLGLAMARAVNGGGAR